MRCQSCNAHLSIEDEKCPYCGAPNPEAIKHRQDMKKFSGDYTRTKFSVLKTASENAQKSMRIIVICVMVLLVILSVLFYANSWDFSYAVVKWQAAANSEKYYALLDQYEENGDYISLAALYDQKSLYGVDKFNEYRYVYNAASNYQHIFGYISTLLEEEHWEDEHENALKYLCETLDYYYESTEREPDDYYSDMGCYKEQHLDAVEHITEKIESLLQLTFSISEEEMNEFRNYSSAEKQVFIERRFEGNAKDI